VRRLIVNADDYGLSRGVNRGVIEANRRGILTSASMIVGTAASEEAAALAAENPALGVGLHVVLPAGADGPAVARELESQLTRFVELTGRLPTHVDSHHDVHRREPGLRAFVAFARRHALPLRGHCAVRHIASFYGQWDGESHLEQISSESLAGILLAELEDGFNELATHPGYTDSDLRSSYRRERQRELETLCDPAIARLLAEHGIALARFEDVHSA